MARSPHDPVKPLLRGWSHAVAAGAAVAALPIVVATAPGVRVAATVYAAAVVGLFGVSALYHRGAWAPRAHAVLQRVDHSMIFVAIAATYTPIAVAALPPDSGRLILWVVWLGAAAGVATQMLWPSAPRAVDVALYVAVGWSALLVIDDMWLGLGVAGSVLVVAGGVLYTLGAVVYGTRRPDPWPRHFGFHEVFHLLVVAAAALHYAAVTLVAIPRGAPV